MSHLSHENVNLADEVALDCDFKSFRSSVLSASDSLASSEDEDDESESEDEPTPATAPSKWPLRSREPKP